MWRSRHPTSSTRSTTPRSLGPRTLCWLLRRIRTGENDDEGDADTTDEKTPADAAAKAVRASLKKKYSDPLSTAAAKAAITAIHSRVGTIFSNAAHHVAAQLRGFQALGKADGDPSDEDKAKAQKAVDDLNLFDVRDLKAISSPLTDVFADAQSTKLDSIGVDVSTALFGQINHQAAEWAQDHAAALVSQITDTTRDQLRATIAQGLCRRARHRPDRGPYLDVGGVLGRACQP